MIPLKKHKVYFIKWRDHFSTDGFFDPTNIGIEKEVILSTVGFFIKGDQNYIHFARTIGTDMYADIMSVLKEQVVEIEELN